MPKKGDALRWPACGVMAAWIAATVAGWPGHAVAWSNLLGQISLAVLAVGVVVLQWTTRRQRARRWLALVLWLSRKEMVPGFVVDRARLRLNAEREGPGGD